MIQYNASSHALMSYIPAMSSPWLHTRAFLHHAYALIPHTPPPHLCLQLPTLAHTCTIQSMHDHALMHAYASSSMPAHTHTLLHHACAPIHHSPCPHPVCPQLHMHMHSC